MEVTDLLLFPSANCKHYWAVCVLLHLFPRSYTGAFLHFKSEIGSNYIWYTAVSFYFTYKFYLTYHGQPSQNNLHKSCANRTIHMHRQTGLGLWAVADSPPAHTRTGFKLQAWGGKSSPTPFCANVLIFVQQDCSCGIQCELLVVRPCRLLAFRSPRLPQGLHSAHIHPESGIHTPHKHTPNREHYQALQDVPLVQKPRRLCF